MKPALTRAEAMPLGRARLVFMRRSRVRPGATARRATRGGVPLFFAPHALRAARPAVASLVAAVSVVLNPAPARAPLVSRGSRAGAATNTAIAADSTAATASAAPESGTPAAPPPAPPPLDTPYVQFGVALTTEIVAGTGRLCAAAQASNGAIPCILGTGGGVVARVGRRSAGPWYFGAAYELSKQDPSSLYRFATLQQARAEARYYLDTGRDIYPYAAAGSGAVAYGDEGKIDTYGPVETLGIGVEAQVSRRTVVGFSISYRLLILNDYYDAAGYAPGASFVQLVGLDLTIEERSPIVPALQRSVRGAGE